MAEDQDGKTPRRRSTKPLKLQTVPCPDRCDNGQVLVFQQHVGTFGHDTCTRCMGVGQVEVQRG